MAQEKLSVNEQKKCPFCGNVGYIRCCDTSDLYYVQCNGCGAKTKTVNNEIVALALWNHRVDKN